VRDNKRDYSNPTPRFEYIFTREAFHAVQRSHELIVCAYLIGVKCKFESNIQASGGLRAGSRGRGGRRGARSFISFFISFPRPGDEGKG
jgi:hypothetical protein